MDEVRVWRTARSQQEILAHMRDSAGLENHPVSERTRLAVVLFC